MVPRRGLRAAAAALAAAALLGAAARVAAQPEQQAPAPEQQPQQPEKVTASAADANLAVKAMSVEVGGDFRVTSFRLEGDPRGSELELQRFEVGAAAAAAAAVPARWVASRASACVWVGVLGAPKAGKRSGT